MKSIIKKQQIEAITQKLSDYFLAADEIAYQTKFVQRKSPFTGSVFLKAVVFGFLQKPRASLTQLAQQSLLLGVKITPQGIHERINQSAVDFMRGMFLRAFAQFKNGVSLPLAILQQFSAIYLVDSTFKSLPANMAALYPGSGGKASPASLKVQLVFEFLQGNLTQLCIEAGRKADQAYTQYLAVIQTGALILADLGYFCLASLRTIAAKGAYFLMRYHYMTAVFLPNGERIDLVSLLTTQGQTLLDLSVRLGASPNTRLACRLISTPVPSAVAEERRRKAKLTSAAHGKTPSEPYLVLLGWSIFLTNTPQTMLSASQVILFYRIRWQIELIFKFWKSYCGLADIPATRPERVLTEFYAKLLVAVVANFLIAPVRIPEATWSEHELSPFQFQNLLSTFAQRLMLVLSSPLRLRQIIHNLYLATQYFGFKQKRRKKPNICALLAALSIPSLSTSA
jgi:hypothetical protein